MLSRRLRPVGRLVVPRGQHHLLVAAECVRAVLGGAVPVAPHECAQRGPLDLGAQLLPLVLHGIRCGPQKGGLC